jgi:dihydropyrimidinase
MKTLIKNGRIITATDDFTGDILIENEKIIAIGKNLQNTDGTSRNSREGVFVRYF